MTEIATETFTPIYDTFDAVVVSEMAAGAQVLLPLDQEVVARVTEGDTDPKFATFMIESGWSKQRNYWGAEVFESVQEQINNSSEPIVGYLGHISPEQDGYAFPDIQLQWLKSKLSVSQDKVKMLVKAYVLPGTKGRDYLNRGLVRTVSWRGDCLKKPIQGGVAIKDFSLESIDLSRPRKAGMSAALVGGLTSEMDEGRFDVKPDEIGALTQNELRAHNSALVTVIEDEAKKPLQEKVTEMTTAAEEAKPQLDLIPEIKKLLGMSEDGDILEVLGQTMTALKEAGKGAKDAILDRVLLRKFKDDSTRKLVKKILVGEMTEIELVGDEKKDEEAISSKVNEMVDKDEDLKELVSEMEEGREGGGDGNGGSTESNNGRRQSGTREIKDGFKNDRISVRKARR
jgi:hypothetical protein